MATAKMLFSSVTPYLAITTALSLTGDTNTETYSPPIINDKELTSTSVSYNLDPYTMGAESVTDDSVNKLEKHMRPLSDDDLKWYYLTNDQIFETFCNPDVMQPIGDDSDITFIEDYKGDDLSLFKAALVTLSNKLQVPIDYIMACFNNESSLNPASLTSGTAGLNQFISSTLKSLNGMTLKEYSLLPGNKQIPIISEFWAKGVFKTCIDIPVFNFSSVANKSLTKDKIIFKKGSIQYTSNKPFDMNDDGYITVWDIRAFILKTTCSKIPADKLSRFISSNAITIVKGLTPITNSEVQANSTDLAASSTVTSEDWTIDPVTLLHKDDDINGKVLTTLSPYIAYSVARSCNKAWSDGLFVKLVEGERTHERQLELFNSGKGVTKATISDHEYNVAVDIIDKTLGYPALTHVVWDKIESYFLNDVMHNPLKSWDAPHWVYIHKISPTSKNKELIAAGQTLSPPAWFTGKQTLVKIL